MLSPFGYTITFDGGRRINISSLLLVCTSRWIPTGANVPVDQFSPSSPGSWDLVQLETRNLPCVLQVEVFLGMGMCRGVVVYAWRGGMVRIQIKERPLDWKTLKADCFHQEAIARDKGRDDVFAMELVWLSPWGWHGSGVGESKRFRGCLGWIPLEAEASLSFLLLPLLRKMFAADTQVFWKLVLLSVPSHCHLE